jgi:CubicO group peptidase (beta-lactamase class C family)
LKIKKILIGSLISAITLNVLRTLFAKPAFAKTIPVSNTYKDIDAYIDERMHHLRIPGLSLAIVEGDRIAHMRGFGQPQPGGEAPSAQTPFFIGSVTKSFTALAIMQLVEAGKIELDAPVQRYLPWFRVADLHASAQMTVRHLLNQTSGLPMWPSEFALANFDDSPDAAERQIRALSTLKITRLVGAKFEYSNSNFNILGLVVEAVSGGTYSDYIQQHIFDPLEMRHSYTSKAIAQKNGLAMGYRYWFGYPFPAPNLSIPISSLPSGQLISCAEDMAHYLIAHLNGGRYGDVHILSSAGMDELHRGAANVVEMGMSMGSYAMGWFSQVFGKSTIVSHSGIVPDFGAFAGFVPEQKKGIALLYNANHVMIKMTFDELGMGAAQRLAGEVPSKTMFGCALWLMRGMALIPILQVVGVAATLRQVSRWQRDPASRPSSGRLWRQHLLLPMVPNLLVALTLVPMLTKLRGWILLFMPDFSWIARICGGFAAIWAFLRTGLILKALRRDRH